MAYLHKITVLTLFIGVFLPSMALAKTYVTPSGAVVDDLGHLISLPPTHLSPTLPTVKPIVAPVFTPKPIPKIWSIDPSVSFPDNCTKTRTSLICYF